MWQKNGFDAKKQTNMFPRTPFWIFRCGCWPWFNYFYHYFTLICFFLWWLEFDEEKNLIDSSSCQHRLLKALIRNGKTFPMRSNKSLGGPRTLQWRQSGGIIPSTQESSCIPLILIALLSFSLCITSLEWSSDVWHYHVFNCITFPNFLSEGLSLLEQLVGRIV